MIGISAVQVNSTLDALFARAASLEGPAYLWYAIRIEQIPLALFGIALSSALLPPLARALKEGSYDHYLNLLRFALRKGFSLIFPCSCALFVLGVSGINLLYGHGHFTSEAVYQTTLCLWGYGLGLLPSVFVLFLAPAFYADKQFAIPMKGSLFSVGFHLCLTSLFVFGFHWGAFSIALATSLSAWGNYLYLSHHLSKKVGQPLRDVSVSSSFTKTTWSTLVATGGTLLTGIFFVEDPTLSILFSSVEPLFSRDIQLQLMQFVALSGVFVILFFASARLFQAEDALELIGIKKKSPVV
jgi:putative peptidoglycan lipid II flippase